MVEHSARDTLLCWDHQLLLISLDTDDLRGTLDSPVMIPILLQFTVLSMTLESNGKVKAFGFLADIWFCDLRLVMYVDASHCCSTYVLGYIKGRLFKDKIQEQFKTKNNTVVVYCVYSKWNVYLAYINLDLKASHLAWKRCGGRTLFKRPSGKSFIVNSFFNKLCTLWMFAECLLQWSCVLACVLWGLCDSVLTLGTVCSLTLWWLGS